MSCHRYRCASRSAQAAQERRPGIVVGSTCVAPSGTAVGRFHEAFGPSSLLLSGCNMSVALPPGPLRQAGARSEGGTQGSGTDDELLADSIYPASHDQLLLFAESLENGPFAGLDYLVSVLKAGRSVRFAERQPAAQPCLRRRTLLAACYHRQPLC